MLEGDVAGAGHAPEHDGEGVAPVVVDGVELGWCWRGLRDGGGVDAVGWLLGFGHGEAASMCRARGDVQGAGRFVKMFDCRARCLVAVAKVAMMVD